MSSELNEGASVELAIAGLVTAEGATRLWTREGSRDVLVDRPGELRSLLGSGRVDREAMLPHGASTDMAILDIAGRRLILAAPFQPPQKPQPLCEPISIGPQRTEPYWDCRDLRRPGRMGRELPEHRLAARRGDGAGGAKRRGSR